MDIGPGKLAGMSHVTCFRQRPTYIVRVLAAQQKLPCASTSLQHVFMPLRACVLMSIPALYFQAEAALRARVAALEKAQRDLQALVAEAERWDTSSHTL